MHTFLASVFPAKYTTISDAQYEVEAYHRVVSATTSSFALSDKVGDMIVEYAEGIWCCNNTIGADIHVINYEQYINQYTRRSVSDSKRCDFVLYDACRSHFVVAELTHCEQKSLEKPVNTKTSLSKEEYAQLKYQDTIRILCAVPEIRSFIEQCPVKSCVFACRLKEDSEPNDIALRAMAGFHAPVKEVGTITHEKPLVLEDMEFKYTRCIYPDPYIFQ